jgi:hypothetical protein
VRELNQQQKLREGVVLERDALGEPVAGNLQQLNAPHALHVLAQLSRFAGVHDFAQQVFIGEAFGVAAGKALAVFGFEFLDLVVGDSLELVAHRLARFELLAVDENRVRSMEPPAVAVIVAENGELAFVLFGSWPRHHQRDGRAQQNVPVRFNYRRRGAAFDDKMKRKTAAEQWGGLRPSPFSVVVGAGGRRLPLFLLSSGLRQAGCILNLPAPESPATRANYPASERPATFWEFTLGLL